MNNFSILLPQDQPYFRQSREIMFKRSLEEIEAGRDGALETLQAALRPLRRLLGGQKFLAGATPNWADHIVFGALQWGRLMSSMPLLAENDQILDWMGRVLSTYGLEG